MQIIDQLTGIKSQTLVTDSIKNELAHTSRIFTLWQSLFCTGTQTEQASSAAN
jgi:hypothetical protein